MKKGGTPNDGDNEDARLWKAVTKTITSYTKEKRKPFAGKLVEAQTPEKRVKKAAKASIPAPLPAPDKAKVFLKTDLKPARAAVKDFDKGTEAQLKKGKMPPEGRLDLHGMTQDEAHRALRRTITGAVRQGKRTLLVITGKGRVSGGGGVLRRMVPIWLEETDLRAHVIAYTTAPPRDGGDGALYIRLRKQKD